MVDTKYKKVLYNEGAQWDKVKSRLICGSRMLNTTSAQYNPPYNKNVKTNVGKEFLKIIGQCFPTSNSLHKIFNKNTIKLSYSCMPNLEVIIESDNKWKMQAEKQSKQDSERKCNCQKSRVYQLNGECLAKDIIYQATVTSGTETENYVGLTAATFKARYANHKASFNFISKRNATELSKHIWQLKDNNSEYAIKWKILSQRTTFFQQNKAVPTMHN